MRVEEIDQPGTLEPSRLSRLSYPGYRPLCCIVSAVLILICLMLNCVSLAGGDCAGMGLVGMGDAVRRIIQPDT